MIENTDASGSPPSRTTDADLVDMELSFGGAGAKHPPPVKKPPLALKGDGISFFEKYLTLWVLLCMVAGTAIGNAFPVIGTGLASAEYAHINFPMTVLLWLMLFPMTLGVDFNSIRDVRNHPRAILITTMVNYALQPFIVYGLSLLFFKVAFVGLIPSTVLQDEYVAGAVILGGAPCTAMVFVWSMLVHGDPAYTLVQVAVNDLLIVILYYPTLILLLNTTSIPVPYDTLALSIFLYVVVPFTAGAVFKWSMAYDASRIKSIEERAKPVTIVALLLTLLLIFMSQGRQIVDSPVNVLLICVPLVAQTFLVSGLAYFLLWWWSIPKRLAGPGGMIASSNFFELAVGVTISAYGANSGATLVCTVGVLTEVPSMLTLVWLFNHKLVRWFPDG